MILIFIIDRLTFGTTVSVRKLMWRAGKWQLDPWCAQFTKNYKQAMALLYLHSLHTLV